MGQRFGADRVELIEAVGGAGDVGVEVAGPGIGIAGPDRLGNLAGRAVA
jgi:hypothetical protein